MSLRKKALMIISITVTVLVILLYTVTKSILLGSFNELEQRSGRRDVQRILNALSDNIIALNREAGDWAAWDETYRFIDDNDENYVKTNLPDETFTELNINFISFINTQGRVVFSKAFDLDEKKEIPVPSGLLEYLSVDNPLLRHNNEESKVRGVIVLPEGPALVASRPILTSDRQGPVKGALIMGIYLNNTVIRSLADITGLNLDVDEFGDEDAPPDFQKAGSILSEDAPVYIQPLDAETIAGYALVQDVYENPGLILRVSIPREIYKQGQASVRYFIGSMLAVGLALTVMSLLLLEKTILSRLAGLSDSVVNIGAKSNPAGRVLVSGNDELTILASEINKMLESLESSRHKLSESEEKYRTMVDDVLDSSAVGILILDREHKIVWLNRALQSFMGLGKDEVVGKDIRILIDQKIKYIFEDREAFVQRLLSAYADNKYVESLECHVLPVGELQERWLEHWSQPVQLGLYTGGRIEHYFDVTERKRMDEQLKYLSLHDPLTGLHNRAYFNEEMRRLEEDRHLPLGVIVCDLDGLKLINDTMGHDAGNDMLVTAANILKNCFSKGDMVARIGGDEYVVLLPRTDRLNLEKACQRIRESIKNYNFVNPEIPLSMSIGFAIGEKSAQKPAELFREADINMYREKLSHTQSTRSIIVQALKKMLEARDFATEGHSERMQDLVAQLAVVSGIPEYKLNDLRLVALFHDLGKIGVPDRILFKSGSLNKEEYVEIKKHCEIGFQIANSVPDLVPIADWILKHHESFDGKGYPLGLKGKNIPLECRILSIVDAYDAMTSDRPYRKAMMHKEAVDELKRCSGTQFDPLLVQKFTRMLDERLITRQSRGPK
ncbi:MAG: Cyclic di-GMP phosphodiesterase response regulator RpfG [Pelotomaculum sp. PtaB.Bin013]|uniref:Diguanylate cyclase n=1 Tax=Pelotomaculum isophthalicicum JI TaxID=947010 RepID=A0A9X4GYI3_9FIRM|nr:CHASE4 domain-containing protein [Pelotomaculum isophthalicicum]MDF9407807.1 diguanylate cyclase [Pelotomaculum isophthalicicum JI]OPX88925.1 MAG: Cyclic di-GMP phosphodiesterase response regulator RpfG [Pelotomaculum sp. PtaB.Bin013]